MIEPLNKYDTRAVVKITEWLEQNTLDKLNQYSTVEGKWFWREVLIGGNLCTLIENLQMNGELKYEVVKTYHNPSEKLHQGLQEENNDGEF